MQIACASHSPTRCGHEPTPRPNAEAVTLTPGQEDAYAGLIQVAQEARNHAYTPKSHSMVGAALLSASGKIYKGANFELTDYADHGEQKALERALKAGERPEDLVACATFIAKEGQPTAADFQKQEALTACGNCRQAFYEINPNLHEIVLGQDGRPKAFSAGGMLPHAYHRQHPPSTNPAPPPTPHSDPLIQEALVARSRAYVPRTHEAVGAAVETTDGKIYTGIQVEASSFTGQALRNALSEALFEKAWNIKRVTVLGGDADQVRLPKRLTWDAIQAVAQIAPQAQMVLPDGQGGFFSKPIQEVPGYLMTHPDTATE